VRSRGRAALRFATWALATFATLVVAGVAIARAGWGTLAGYAVLDALLLAVSFACWRRLDRLRPRQTPLAPGRASARRFLRGAASGAALVAVVALVLAAAGAFELAPKSCAMEPLLRFVAGTGAFVVLAALFEELLFRGYGLFALRDLAGRAVAVPVTAVLFAAGHQANPGFGPLAMLNLGLVGLVLGTWVLVERDVWIAVGAHIGWNGMIVVGLAIPVSGVAIPAPCHAGILSGPEWLTGGAFGVEGGLPTALVWLGFGLWLLRRNGGRPARGDSAPTG
jgi:membrane protease YdiL (CAAX protease family)